MSLTELDTEKLSVVRNDFNPNNFDVLYDGHKLRVFLKATPTIVKRSKFYERRKYMKLKDKCIRKIWWRACWKIAQLLMNKVASENKFYWFTEWYKIWISFCDNRFSSKFLYHSEESSIAIGRVVMMEEDKYSRWYILDSELSDAHVLLPPEKYKKARKSADSDDLVEGDKGDVTLLN